MKPLLLAGALAAGACLSLYTAAFAHDHASHGHGHDHLHAPAHHPTFHRHSHYWQWRAYSNWYYPKYYGAFHARYYQHLGVPSGDIGLRGEPW